jgi:CRISPR/Cas system CMR subunit Cmr6 (Cas7 group RAMP superfamily)
MGKFIVIPPLPTEKFYSVQYDDNDDYGNKGVIYYLSIIQSNCEAFAQMKNNEMQIAKDFPEERKFDLRKMKKLLSENFKNSDEIFQFLLENSEDINSDDN